jgi:hypothetical protein
MRFALTLCLLSLPAWADAPAATPAPAAPTAVTPADFTCLSAWPAVGHTRFASLTGQLDAALAVARDPAGGDYPAGTLVAFQPSEAMLKLAPGSQPATDDWLYIKLKVGAKGVEIKEQGGAEVRNIAGTCAGCHGAAAAHDEVCASDHGCKALPGFVVKAALKAVEKDPRCPKG